MKKVNKNKPGHYDHEGLPIEGPDHQTCNCAMCRGLSLSDAVREASVLMQYAYDVSMRIVGEERQQFFMARMEVFVAACRRAKDVLKLTPKDAAQLIEVEVDSIIEQAEELAERGTALLNAQIVTGPIHGKN